jgi:hypothetical protein
MLAETWYSAEEAVEQGLADSVEAAPEPKDQNAFDLSMFRHAGRDDAPDPAFVAVAPAAPAEPEPPQQPETDAAPTGPSELMQRRHRMNQRRVDGRAPVTART